MPFRLDSEVSAVFEAMMGSAGKPPPIPIGDVKAIRDMCNAMMMGMQASVPNYDDVSQKDFYTKAADGHDLLLRWYTKTEGTQKDSPAVIYMHGGGMIAMSVSNYDKVVQNYVHQTGIPFLSVEYRLAPEFPAPIPVEDSYAGLKWLHSNSAKLGVDPNRIALMGDSGGGGVAASLAHFAIKKGGPKIAKQILIYPMIDDRNTVPDENLVPFATWSYNDNTTGWQSLLGPRCGGEGILPEDAAARMTVEDAKHLPETYIDVGELDLFRDEDIGYAKKCTLAGVSTELHVYPGVPHAWEGIAPGADVSKRAIANRLKAIMSI